MKKSFIRVLSVLLAMILASAVLVACDIGGSKKDKKDKDKDSDTSKTFDVDTMQADLEEAGYLVSTEPVGEDSLYEGAEHVLVALLDDYRISVYFFDTKANAKTAHEQMKEAFDIIGEDFDFKLKGNIIYIGSEKAIKDAGIESTTTTRPSNKPSAGTSGNAGDRQTEVEEDYCETFPVNGYETEFGTASIGGIEYGSGGIQFGTGDVEYGSGVIIIVGSGTESGIEYESASKSHYGDSTTEHETVWGSSSWH